MTSILNSLKLIADPTRLRLLVLLREEPLSVAELQQILGMAQSRISTQLSILKKEGLVSDQRSGKNNIYTTEMPTRLGDLLEMAAREVPETSQDASALRFILRKRNDTARAYFDEMAGKFGRHYVPGRSWKSLAEALIQSLDYDTIADLGAGDGPMPQLLAQRARKVIAIDNSEKMVEFGQKLARENNLPHLEYRLGDIEAPPIEASSVDLAIFSQALHHAEHPAKAVAAAFAFLKPGGRLLILDLMQHTFEKARELYHDVWLGFGEGELADLLQKGGFEKVSTAIVDREEKSPHFQTLLAAGSRPR